MAIKGATFDWWGTIAMVPPPAADAAMRELRVDRLDRMLRRNGIGLDRSVLYEAYDRQGDRLNDAWAHDRELSPVEQVDVFLEMAEVTRRDDSIVSDLSEALGGAILVRPPTLFPHIRETLDRLREQGLAIGLISNTGRSWGRYLTKLQEAMGIGQYFDVRVYSDEQGTRKPNPQMFESALKALGLGPRDVVHIGDDVIADIATAKGLGMHAVWFNTGFWPGAATDRADAEIRDHRELPSILEAWEG